MPSGIYKIQSVLNPRRIYIGSAIDIKKRWNEHHRGLRLNSHHSKKLQRHYNKYGEADLQFSILLECKISELIPTEQYFIDSYSPYFNCSPTAGSTLGVKRTPEQCKKNRESHLGEKNVRFGKKLSDEHRQILIDSNKNRIVSEETREKIRQYNIGRKASKETRDKMREQRLGKPTPMKGLPAWNKGMKNIYSEETLQKIRDARKHQVFSEESRKKKSETMKRIWAERLGSADKNDLLRKL